MRWGCSQCFHSPKALSAHKLNNVCLTGEDTDNVRVELGINGIALPAS